MESNRVKPSIRQTAGSVYPTENRPTGHQRTSAADVYPSRAVLSVCEHFSVEALATCTCLNLAPGLAPISMEHSGFAKYVAGQPDSEPDWDEAFDLIICDDCYHEFANLEQLTTEIYRLLRPGGFCYLSGCHRLSSMSNSRGQTRRVYRTEASIQKYLSDFWIHDYAELIEQSPATFCRSRTQQMPLRDMLATILRQRRCLKATEFVWVLTKKR